jgi:uncharacterized OB-fold protein
MSVHSIVPDFSSFQIPMDSWSEPFWKAATEHTLLMPRCLHCATFRWPAGPFCPKCRRQPVEWVPPGQGRIYSFTVMPVAGSAKDAPPNYKVAALVEFDAAKDVRLVSVLVDAPLDAIRVDAAVEIGWLAAANASVPVFRLRGRQTSRGEASLPVNHSPGGEVA